MYIKHRRDTKYYARQNMFDFVIREWDPQVNTNFGRNTLFNG